MKGRFQCFISKSWSPFTIIMLTYIVPVYGFCVYSVSSLSHVWVSGSMDMRNLIRTYGIALSFFYLVLFYPVTDMRIRILIRTHAKTALTFKRILYNTIGVITFIIKGSDQGKLYFICLCFLLKHFYEQQISLVPLMKCYIVHILLM